MPGDLSTYLSERMARGACQLGQVQIGADFALTHFEDFARDDLQVFSNPHDAIEIAKFDDAGKYRPLKTAPNLRHGWKLALSSMEEILPALDFLYPAAVGTLAAMERGILAATSFRTTLNRQSGMYAVVKKITDESAEKLIQDVCGGCLRKRLWQINDATLADIPIGSSELAIFCVEACNLLIAAGRAIMKGETPRD